MGVSTAIQIVDVVVLCDNKLLAYLDRRDAVFKTRNIIA
jgi:hypothetical protein